MTSIKSSFKFREADITKYQKKNNLVHADWNIFKKVSKSASSTDVKGEFSTPHGLGQKMIVFRKDEYNEEKEEYKKKTYKEPINGDTWRDIWEACNRIGKRTRNGTVMVHKLKIVDDETLKLVSE